MTDRPTARTRGPVRLLAGPGWRFLTWRFVTRLVGHDSREREISTFVRPKEAFPRRGLRLLDGLAWLGQEVLHLLEAKPSGWPIDHFGAVVTMRYKHAVTRVGQVVGPAGVFHYLGRCVDAEVHAADGIGLRLPPRA
jgi:hypothetical protein